MKYCLSVRLDAGVQVNSDPALMGSPEAAKFVKALSMSWETLASSLFRVSRLNDKNKMSLNYPHLISFMAISVLSFT